MTTLATFTDRNGRMVEAMSYRPGRGAPQYRVRAVRNGRLVTLPDAFPTEHRAVQAAQAEARR